MLGKHKVVAAFMKEKNPDMYIIGSPWHLMHLADLNGSKNLGYQLDDLLVDIWYYIDKSSLRHRSVKELQQKHGLEAKKILKHVCTGWLSLGKALSIWRIWDPLLEFFEAECAALPKPPSYEQTVLLQCLQSIEKSVASTTNKPKYKEFDIASYLFKKFKICQNLQTLE